MSSPPMALDVHIVSHTHWDREWYHSFERFRQRLVALVDELLDDPPRAPASFLLDGQAILIDDYGAVRLDRLPRLAELIRTGALEAGPWYVLADELIPSGEAIVRNLLAGRRTLARIGAKSPPVLYCPDSFGHPSTLPDIAAGFGLPLIILWRGYGGARWPGGDTVRWVAPSGASAVLFHLPRDGYEFGSHLPTNSDGARLRWERVRAELAPRSATGVLLIPNGADHHARQRDLNDALAALEQNGKADNAHRSSLTQFAERLVERASSQTLPVVRGELRDSYGYTWTLQGTFGTRAHEKRMNARAERALVREAEPWSALAAHTRFSRRALVEAAWKDLLTAQPHDTLCGCSIDEVARAMEVRVRAALEQANGMRDDAILDLLGHDPVAAREAPDRWTPVVVVRNAAPRTRSGVAIADVEEFVTHVSVGPGSAPRDSTPPLIYTKPKLGELGPVQVLARSTRNSRTESPRHYPDNDLVTVQRVAVWVPGVPPYGVSTHAIGGRARRIGPSQPVVTTTDSLRNAHLHLAVDDAGRVAIEHVPSGRRIADALSFIDEADAGDLYTASPRPRDGIVQCRGVTRTHRGPLRGELETRYVIRDRSRRGRSEVDLSVRLVLDADAPFVRVDVSGENRGSDHRTRVVLRSDVANAAVWADAAFGPVRREPIVPSAAESAVEHAPPTAPLHRYVSLFNDAAGFTAFSDGLAEYEATPAGEVIVTLVRAVGELSKNDLPERPGHAGWPTPTPAAQCLGHFEASFAVMLHGPRLAPTVDEIERAADDVLLSLAGSSLRSAMNPPASVSGPRLTGAGLAFSAIKESEDGEWLVLRCVNRRDDETPGAWRLPFEVREANLARLDETPAGALDVSGNDVSFTAPPRAIVTILVR
ncbi:MAG: glycosyl hydrolase-related protein [Gemmatimonadaceae bacterium]